MANKLELHTIYNKKPYKIDKFTYLIRFLSFHIINVLKQQFMTIYDSMTKYNRSIFDDTGPFP